jgi:hypothetical protein
LALIATVTTTTLAVNIEAGVKTEADGFNELALMLKANQKNVSSDKCGWMKY